MDSIKPAAVHLANISLLFMVVSALSAEPVRDGNLPSYQPQPLEFPPHHSGKRMSGEFVSADFIHRTGQFRATKSGELIDFTLPPYGAVTYLNAEADLSDVPLGTNCLFILNQDADGNFTRLAKLQDQSAIDSNDRDTDQLASENQRRKFAEFTRARGLPGWIDRTDGNNVTVTFFSGDPSRFKETWMNDFAVGKTVRLCVANDELRTWNPIVDGEPGQVVKETTVPVNVYGCSGFQVVIAANNMLEGFRQGRVVRVFGSGWPARDQPFAESLLNYGLGTLRSLDFQENPAKEYPEQFPFRTEFGNRHLPWYQPQAGVPPPVDSQHVVMGELNKVDAVNRTGEFRADRIGELVRFTLSDSGARLVQNVNKPRESGPIRTQEIIATIRRHGAEAKFEALELGERYRFYMYQDLQGAFTRCTFIGDEYSHLAQQNLTYRITALDLDDHKLHVAWQHTDLQNYNGDIVPAPDFGHSILRVTADTRIWENDSLVQRDNLAIGDLLLVNLTSEQPGQPARVADLWLAGQRGVR